MVVALYVLNLIGQCMNNNKFLNIISKPGYILLAFLIGCTHQSENKIDYLLIIPEVVEVGHLVYKKSVTINNEVVQLQSTAGRLQSDTLSKRLYGIDIRAFRPFYVDLETSSSHYLVKRGAGPNELMRPLQITVKNEHEIFIYDNGLAQIAHFENDEIIRKTVGYLKNNLSERDLYGKYWNNHILATIENPSVVNSLEFDKIEPIVKYNLDDASMNTIGMYSPTADRMDHVYKWVHIALDKKRDMLYYVYHTDYTIMGYNLNTGENFVASTLKPEKFRVRSMPSEVRDTPVSREEMIKRGLDRTHVQGIDIFDDKLIVVWGNGLEDYYQSRSLRTADNMEIFGLVYDLPDLNRAHTISMNQIFIGMYGRYILLEANDDIVEYTIDFYEFKENM